MRFSALHGHNRPIGTVQNITNDTVTIQRLRLQFLVNGEPKKLQISTNLHTSFERAGSTDDLKYSINYAVLSRQLLDYSKENAKRSFPTYNNLGMHIFNDILCNLKACSSAKVEISRQLDAGGEFGVEMERTKAENGEFISDKLTRDQININGLKCMAVIGVFTFERFKKQPVVLDITIPMKFDGQTRIPGFNESLAMKIRQYVEESNFKTVEALSINVNKMILQGLPENDAKVCVSVRKPDAIVGAESVGVQSDRTREQIHDINSVAKFDSSAASTDKFQLPNLNSESQMKVGKTSISHHIAYLAFGTNQGNQLQNINNALKALEAKKIHIIATSSLYRSKPMYYLEQADFFNGCLKVSTDLTPEELLKELKDIEYNILHRVKKFANGPRSIDLDIILYDNLIVNTPDLNIPHIRMLERTFVMLPLCELVPPDMLHPVTAEPLHSHLQQLLTGEKKVDKNKQESSDLWTIVPIQKEYGSVRYMEYGSIHKKSKTQLMAILNVTPDSFSDGSADNLRMSNAMDRVASMISNDVDIIDVGGCSTRPNSVQATEDEELSRIIPVVKAIKEKYGDKILVSVDTYRARVAEETIKVGADIINDISAGMFDDKMYSVVAKYGVPYIINHTRGNINTMTSLTDYSATLDGNFVIYNERTTEGEIEIGEIGKELSKLMCKMFQQGIRRWQLILDPGLGFAKGLSANVMVIRNLPYFKRYKQLDKRTGQYISFDNIPVLLGPSRKRFIGTITGKNPAKKRVEGTGACVAAGIGFGSDIVRVHDYMEMKDVCLMSDAIYKGIY